MKRLGILLIALLILVGQVRGEDSVRTEGIDTVKFTPQQLILPASLIAVGAVSVATPPLKRARKWINNEIGIHNCAPYDDYIQYLPAAGYLFLDFAGVKSRRPFVDRLIVGATGAIIATALTQGTKHCVRERRPTGSRLNSFPSGHTTTAFLGAELLRQDYGPWVGAAGYVVASGVGVMRILNGRHWLNDVLAGAGIGILSARAAEWLLPFNRRWLGLDKRRGEAAVVVPTYSPDAQAVGLTAAIIF
ncbi:MAG: phosphatase PAP2 family protein [Bacteroides sp.]|nr:phosphatase PAP2 family protein [Bacteroides sp.]MCM1379292.1 phosphatase PAP2 family protein [Bacteroides sp.]MCM1445049.1 phosphatase PAP2 family protein [Prevotella sp.]